MEIFLFVYYSQQILKSRSHDPIPIVSLIPAGIDQLSDSGYADLMKLWVKVTQHTNICLQFSLQTVTERS